MKILRIAMNGEEHPHYSFTNAFTETFDEVKTVWWEQIPDVNGRIIDEVRNNKFDAVFMQIQGAGIIKEETAKIVSEHSIGFNWTGDVRTNTDWYKNLGKHLVTCFTNMTDVDEFTSLGLKAEYLQIGYDTKYYYPAERECHNNIVFCANYYPHTDFPLTNYRRAIVEALKREFGDKFNLYGNNWNEASLKSELPFVNNEQEAEIYRTCGIAINCSHFNYSRYSSDRLLRELGSGAFVLSHNYKDIEKDFLVGRHLDVFDGIDDLIKKCHYYLQYPGLRKQISARAYAHASANCTWLNRMKELKQIIKKYQK
jgi:hypothetical protein